MSCWWYKWQRVDPTSDELDLVVNLGGSRGIGDCSKTRVCTKCPAIDDRLERYIETLRHAQSLKEIAKKRYVAFRSNEGKIEGALSLTPTEGGEMAIAGEEAVSKTSS